MSEDPRNSQDLHTLDTVDESPRSSKGSLRSFPSPEKSSIQDQASTEKGRKLSRNMMNVSFRSEADMLTETAHISEADAHMMLLGQDSPVPPGDNEADGATAAATPAKMSSVFEAELPPLINAVPSPAAVPRWHVAPYTPAPTPKKAPAAPAAATPVAASAPQAHTVHVPPVPPRDTSPRQGEHSAPRRRESSGAGTIGRKSHPATVKVPTEPPPRFSTSMKVAASPARHVANASSSGQEDSPPRFRFCVICSTLVSPHGTSSAAHTAPHGGKHSGAHGIACSHPEHQQGNQAHCEPAAAKADHLSERRDASPQNLRSRLPSHSEEPETRSTRSPPRPERLSSPGRDVSPGRPRHAQEQLAASSDGFQAGLGSPVRRSLTSAGDFTGADGRLAGLSLHPESVVRQISTSSRESAPVGPGLFPQTSVPTTSLVERSGLGDLQELMNKLAQQQLEIDELRQSHRDRLVQHTPGKPTAGAVGGGAVGVVGTSTLTNTHPALLHSTNLNLGSPHLKVAGSVIHSYKANSTDQLQQQLSVSKPRLGGSTGQFNGNMTPNSTVRSHDSHRSGDSPLSAPHAATVGAHTATRKEAQGPHGLPHSETPVMTLPSQAPQPAYHTREYQSPVRNAQSLNLTELAVGSPHFALGRDQQQLVPPASAPSAGVQARREADRPTLSVATELPAPQQAPQPCEHQVPRSEQQHSTQLQGPTAAQQHNLPAAPPSQYQQYVSPVPPVPFPAQVASRFPQAPAPLVVQDTTDPMVLQILRCLRERIAKLQQRHHQACSQERIHPQYNIALNADGTSRAYADVSVICARNLPIMKRQQKSCDAYIELQLITQFPSHHNNNAAGASSNMHTMRVDTSSFLSGQVYNRLDLLYQAHNYAQYGWPAQGVNAHSLDAKVNVADRGVQFNAYGRTTVQKSTLFPEWRETFKFASLAYIPSQSLLFIIKDATYAGHQVDADDTVVGFAVLPLRATLLADQHPHVMWLPLQQPPQLRHSGVHRLSEDCALKVEVKVHFSEQEYWRHLLAEAELILHKVSSSLTALHHQQQQGHGGHVAPAASNLTPAEGRKLEKWLDAMIAAGPAPVRPVAPAPPLAQLHALPPPQSQRLHAATEPVVDMHRDHQPHDHDYHDHQALPQQHHQAPQQVSYLAQSSPHVIAPSGPASAVRAPAPAAPVVPSPVAFQGHVPLEQRPHHFNYAQAVHISHNEAARPTVPDLPLTLSDPSMHMQDPGHSSEYLYQPSQEELMSPMAFSAISSVTNSPTAPATYQHGGRFFGADRASERALNTPGQARPQNLYPATPLVNFPGRPVSRTRKTDANNDTTADASRTDSGTKGRLKIVGLREQSNRDVFLKTLRTDTTSPKKTTSKPLGVSTVPLPAELFRTPAPVQTTTDHRLGTGVKNMAAVPPPLPVHQRLYQDAQQVPLQARGQGLQRVPASGVKPAAKMAPPPLPIQSQSQSPLQIQTPAQPRVDLSIFKRAGTDMVYQGEVRSDVGNKLQRSAQSRNEKLGFLSAGPKLLKF